MDEVSEARVREWEEQYKCATDAQPERRKDFKNSSGIPLKPVYTPADVRSGYEEGRGFPGEYPYTRGIYQTMYRGRPWSRRMLIGLEVPETWNQRQKRMFEAGQTATNIVFCNVTYRGLDVDEVEKELVGTCGTPLSSTRDVAICFDGMPLDQLSTALNDSPPFTIVAMYATVAKRQGIAIDRLRGTTNQSDFISHYISCHMHHRFPLDAYPRLLVDHVKYCIAHMPQWNPLSIIGQHMQQSGATPAQELAFTLASGLYYVDLCVKAGLPVDTFAPRFTFFFDVTLSIFEEVAKFRAARRIWAKALKERFGAQDPRSWRLKFHAQTSGRELTREQALNNVSRVTLQALAAVLGGCQSLHTDSYDELFGTPGADSARVAVMTQNIIAEESGAADVIDPLGGSYYVESLTDEMERRVGEYLEKIEAMGGMLEATRRGYPQAEIAKSSLSYQRSIDRGERVVIGLNSYQIPEDLEDMVSLPAPDIALVERQLARTEAVRRERDAARAQAAMDMLRRAIDDPRANTFEAVLSAVEAELTHGEIVRVFREQLGAGRPLIGVA